MSLHALGALDGKDLVSVQGCLDCPMSAAKDELTGYENLVSAISASFAAEIQPSTGLKRRILDQIGPADEESDPAEPEEKKQSTSTEGDSPGFSFLLENEGKWRPMPAKGVRVKELSSTPNSGYVMLLLEIDAGCGFPSHRHHGTEEVYLISGDLQTGGRTLGPGDYMRARSGSHHDRLFSENGCRAVLVTSRSNYPRTAIHGYGLVHNTVSKLRDAIKNLKPS